MTSQNPTNESIGTADSASLSESRLLRGFATIMLLVNSRITTESEKPDFTSVRSTSGSEKRIVKIGAPSIVALMSLKIGRAHV